MKTDSGFCCYQRFWFSGGTAVYADVADYQTVMQEEQKENKTIQTFRQTMDRAGFCKGRRAATLLYVTAKAATLRSVPGDEGEALAEVCLGDEVSRSLCATITE